MDCQACHQPLEEAEAHVHAGQTLCEDCYIDRINPAKGCDPWAVYTATRLPKDQLSELGRRIMDLIQAKGQVDRAELLALTAGDAGALDRELASLRHMELLRGVFMPTGGRAYRAFNS